MSYKILTNNVLLRDVCIECYNTYTDSSEELLNLGRLTVRALISNICTSEKVKNVITNCEGRSGIEVMLTFTTDDNEVLIDLINTTSDVESEWFSVPVDSKIVIDSILFNHNIVTEFSDAFLTDNKGYETLDKYYEKLVARKLHYEFLINMLAREKYSIEDCFGNKELITGDMNSQGSKNIIADLKYIPVDNIRKLLLNFIDINVKCSRDTFSEFLGEAAKLGHLSFEPYITRNSHNNPTLVLKYNRYVHLFRGYHYQCSYTADGVGTYSNAGVRIDHTTNSFPREFKQGKLLKMLYYMNLIACCKCLDTFNKLLRKHPEVVDEFMRESTANIFDDYDITFKGDMLSMINSMDSEVDYAEPIETLRVPVNDTSDYCRVKVFNANTVAIEFSNGSRVNEVMFTLPDCGQGVSTDVLRRFAAVDEMSVEEFVDGNSKDIYSNSDIYLSLVNFAMNMCDFVINFVTVYSISDKEDISIRALNNPNIGVIKNLSSFDVKRIIQ